MSLLSKFESNSFYFDREFRLRYWEAQNRIICIFTQSGDGREKRERKWMSGSTLTISLLCTVGRVFFPKTSVAIAILFWLKWAGYLAVAGLNFLARCVKPNARRLTHLACDYAHSFTHQKGLSYQIIELEDSGLPQQGILPISAKKE